MATSIHASSSLPVQGAKDVRDIVLLRLITGYVLLVVSLIGLLGGDWDIQWHAVIGRDRTFTPPHIMILLGIGAAGLVALASIFLETLCVKRHSELEPFSTDFLGILHSSLGSYLVGFGAASSAVAFPLDTYWHSLYGIDISLWAPFHLMLYAGAVIATFGIIYILLSAAHLSEIYQRTSIFAYGGALLILGVLLSKLCTLAFPALGALGILHLAFGNLVLFPLLMSVLAVIACTLAVRVLPWPWSATSTIVMSLLLYLLVSAFIRPAMVTLVQAEHQEYLPRAAQIGTMIVPLLGQTPFLLLAGIAIDGVVWLGHRRNWLPRTMDWGIMITATLGMLVVITMTLLSFRLGQANVQGMTNDAIRSLLLSLLPVFPGTLVGSWLGLKVGATIQKLQR